VILEEYEGRPSLKRYCAFLVQISHFDNDMTARFSYADFAAAAILVAASIADPAAALLVPAFLHTDRTAQAVATLRQVAARHGLQLPDPKPDVPLPSPTAVDASSLAWG
jgi:hypothetical protein